MTTAAPSTALATIQPAFTDAERVTLAGYLAGYRGLTREAYALDLRQFASWCRSRSLALFAVRRADIEGFARDLEARGRARATVTRRLCTIAGFYKYAVEEELLEHSPAAHVRRPRVDYESHATALDRNELGALLVAAGLGPPLEHALISLLALNGLRVSEATGADIVHLGLERGHRTLTITRKGDNVAGHAGQLVAGLPDPARPEVSGSPLGPGAGRLRGRRQARPVAGGGDRPDQFFYGGQFFYGALGGDVDPSRLGGEVDRRTAHTRDPAQSFLDGTHAAGAGHALDFKQYCAPGRGD